MAVGVPILIHKINYEYSVFLHYERYLWCSFIVCMCSFIFHCFHREIPSFLCLKFVLFRLVVHDHLGYATWNGKLVHQRSLQTEEALGDSLWWHINFLYSRKARCILISKHFTLDTRNAAYFVVYSNYMVRLFLQVLNS